MLLENQVNQLSNEISFESFSNWQDVQKKIGTDLVNEAFSFIANKYDLIFLSNPINPSSFAHFIRSDVQSKDFSIRKRTLRAGIANGFLEKDHDFQIKPLKFQIENKNYHAIARDTQECLVEELLDTDVPTLVSCTKNGFYIVSDIDLIAIYQKKTAQKNIFDSEYGELTTSELAIIKDLNQYFQKLVFKDNINVSHLFKLVAHGPANRFSGSKASHIHYPITIHTPNQSIEYLDGQAGFDFLDFNQKMESIGYYAGLNPKWIF